MFQKSETSQDLRRFIGFRVRVEILSRHTNMGMAVRVAKFSNGGEVYIQPLFQYRYLLKYYCLSYYVNTN